jgi:hypothetical protein
MNPTLWDYLFVTPDAYFRIFDLPYQIEIFNTYHKRVLSRVFHAVFAVPSLFGWFLLFSYLNLGFVFLCLLSLWYLRLDRRIGLITLPMIVLMWMAAGFVSGAAGGSTFRLSLIVLGGSCLLQSLSHAVEDVPPPLSNRKDRWAPVKEWVKETSIFKKILLLVWGVVLEAITAPRQFPVIVSVFLAKFKNAPQWN